MSGYQKPCIFCHKEIRLSNDTGKWLPYNLDGSSHECKKSEQTPTTKQQVKQQEQQQEQQQQSTLTLESIDKRLKRIEFTLFGKEEQ